MGHTRRLRAGMPADQRGNHVGGIHVARGPSSLSLWWKRWAARYFGSPCPDPFACPPAPLDRPQPMPPHPSKLTECDGTHKEPAGRDARGPAWKPCWPNTCRARFFFPRSGGSDGREALWFAPPGPLCLPACPSRHSAKGPPHPSKLRERDGTHKENAGKDARGPAWKPCWRNTCRARSFFPLPLGEGLGAISRKCSAVK